MKSTYLLNQDKLVYNERVLQERASESQATILHQRRKLARQREVLALLKVTTLSSLYNNNIYYYGYYYFMLLYSY